MLHQPENPLLDHKPTRWKSRRPFVGILLTSIALLLLASTAVISTVRTKSNGEWDDLTEVNHLRRQREGVRDIKRLPDSSVVGDVLVVNVLFMICLIVAVARAVQFWRRNRGTA